ncbi:hypothetical protein SAMN05216226_11067 [Halovenus aranensis]|uniref:Flagellin N-terminal-like domain-containing protein n=1 Tax=Halovenus aranensis TaxID=890420 RepID=A0A1G8X2L9_9EURY|nr:hypothetical protein [Halovenus aranensis]SDJ84576.1 hypothetical protein SAMN05216226_11067 [Halovenus aranensis]
MRPIGPRGISEGTGVAVLVVMTVVATASVGMTVTIINDDSNEYGADFSFEYAEELKHLLVFYDDGDGLRAGNLVVAGPQGEVTWAQIEGLAPNETVEPNNLPTRLAPGNAYGAEVNEEDYIEIRYYPEGQRNEENDDPFEEAESVLLASWNEPSEGDGEDGPVEAPES